MSVEKLEQLFIDTFELEEKNDLKELTYMSIPLWDSIGHMALIAGIDELFDVMLDTQDIIDMNSFDATKIILEKYGVRFS